MHISEHATYKITLNYSRPEYDGTDATVLHACFALPATTTLFARHAYLEALNVHLGTSSDASTCRPNVQFHFPNSPCAFASQTKCTLRISTASTTSSHVLTYAQYHSVQVISRTSYRTSQDFVLSVWLSTDTNAACAVPFRSHQDLSHITNDACYTFHLVRGSPYSVHANPN